MSRVLSYVDETLKNPTEIGDARTLLSDAVESLVRRSLFESSRFAWTNVVNVSRRYNH